MIIHLLHLLLVVLLGYLLIGPPSFALASREHSVTVLPLGDSLTAGLRLTPRVAASLATACFCEPV